MASHIILPKEEEEADHGPPEPAQGYRHMEPLPFSATCVRISRDSYPNLRALRNSLPDDDDAAFAKLDEGEYGYILDDVQHLTDYLPQLPTFPNPLQDHPAYSAVKQYFVNADDTVPEKVVVQKNSPRGVHFRRAGPRQRVYFEPEDVKACIVTCGGLCPGLNTVIRELVCGLTHMYNVSDIFGIQNGYKGFYSSNYLPMTPKSVNDIHKRGGTVLGSSRGGHHTHKIVDNIQDRGINQVYIIGGDGTQKGAYEIFKEIRRRGLKVAVAGIPKTIDNDIATSPKLDDTISHLHKTSLHVENCRLLAVLPPFGKFPSLKHLTLDKLPSVKHADGTTFSYLPSVENLKVSSMTSWIEWSHAEEDHGPLLPQITRFELQDCPLLKEVPNLSFLSSLSELGISYCGDFVKALPKYIQLLACLKKLSVSYCDHPLLLSGHQLKSLEYLYLRRCGSLRLIDGLHCFPNLRKVNVLGCPDVLTESSDRSTGQDEQGVLQLTSIYTDGSLLNRNSFLPSVRDLLIAYIEDLYFIPEQEEWFEQLISVEKIEFGFCYFLERLPSTLGRLTSLKALHVTETKPVSLEGVVPQNLQELVMDGYYTEKENNFKPGGSEWVNISHVPYIRINGKTVQNLSISAASSSSNHQI